MNYADLNQLFYILPQANAPAASGMLVNCAESASRMIDNACNRRFDQYTATHYYDIHGDTVVIDDCLPGGESVYVDEVAVTDYEFLPLNDTPKTAIKLNTYGTRLAITGNWGWAAVPADVVNVATYLTRINFMVTASQGLTSERIGNYSAYYAPVEHTMPTTQLISSLVTKYRRVR